MTDLDLLHFEQLKKDVQGQYLKEYTPSQDDISKWKGIDIIYFQEDLRKKAKGNISEKSFYTYFKNSPVTKLPRIDMLNLLSIYAGYDSWYEFKKQHLFAGELLQENEIPEEEEIDELEKTVSSAPELPKTEIQPKKVEINTQENIDLQKSITDNQLFTKNKTTANEIEISPAPAKKNFFKKNAWALVTSVLITITGILGFKDVLFSKTYKYCFIDKDRGVSVINTLEIMVVKENESPLMYKIKPGECFYYSTKDKNLKMRISAPFYEPLEVNRNLENAPEEEKIELKPDDYKMAVYYFSIKDIKGGNPDEQVALIKQKRNQLENLISSNAVIYQVYDNDTYGIERLDKQKYITLVTTPTTSLKNLNVIEMKKDIKGKIVSIKFKIATTDEKNK
ncbi:hypothetical protein J2795_003445 [Chryseobacterium bernardetii]|uniref:Uncharacterized protein n=2 Tax=Chryseobacterium TaxID=59732 RepID=A0A543ECM7_9FLAO|nr:MULTISPECIES: hypothetical protein [Chryseobacterium]MDR6372500.1 hypothetical protein [Chryseobacterium vietnamense]MDR6442718.1 hypothetical protein [Chryseobacterium bernardetii]MDR6488828.1 hypothetical protein [Chryseobacterium vietnamense]TQM19306.1 hypothetical protein FB551_3705 [Chryseobacterium aquifrigidense]